MSFVSWEIALIALLPAIILCGYIYCKDRIEKEPIGLLLLLFGLGAIAYIPTLMLEKVVLGAIDGLFENKITFSADGVMRYSSYGVMILHKFLNAFIGFAFLEIGVKWSILFFSTRKNKNFNYLFDGIVYSVFISLGFAAVENIRFAWINGWEMLVLRSLASIPCHLIAGIIMGYFYTLWNAYEKAKQMEESYVVQGVVSEERLKTPVTKLVLSMVIPMIVNGIYIFAGAIDSRIINSIFYFVVFFMYGVTFVGVEKIAAKDKSSIKFSRKILQDKHPEIEPLAWTSMDAEKGREGE